MEAPLLNALGNQVLVYFAVAKKGEAPVDGKTDLNPEGLTAAWGLHAEAVAERLRLNGLSCSTPDKPDFVEAMLEKLVWIRYPRIAAALPLEIVQMLSCFFRTSEIQRMDLICSSGFAAHTCLLEPVTM